MRLRASSLLALVWLALGPVDARQRPAPPQPPPQFRSGIDLVEVDVAVLDKDRQPVHGLTAADFILTADGRHQSIAAFSEINVADPVDAPSTWMRNVAPDVRSNEVPSDRRLVVLLLDDAQLRVTSTELARSVARKIVERLGPGDLTSVVFTRNNSGAQEFTDDRAKLLAAIGKLTGGFAPAMGPPPAEPVPGMIGEFASRGDPRMDSSPMYFYRASLNALRLISRSLADIPQRRKAVIWISPGIPLDYASSDLRADSDLVFQEAERANVSIYPIDPTGLGGLDNESPQDAGIGSEDTLRPNSLMREFHLTMAEHTGGIAILDRNDFTAGVAEIFRETGSYYLLGFQPATVGDGRFKRLEIKVRRPGLTVRARNGYFAAKPAPVKPTETGTQLAKAMAGPLPKGDIPMQVTVAPFASGGKTRSAVAIVARLRQPGVTARTSRTVELLTSAFSPQGDMRGAQRQTAKVVLLPTGGDAEYEVLSRIDLKPGRYSLRIAADDAALAKSGSVYYDVDVPDFSRDPVALSGVLLSVSPGLPSAPRNALATLVPIVPSTERVFTKDDDVSAFVRVYQGGKSKVGPVTLDIRILDESGTPIVQLPATLAAEAFNAAREADHTVEVPLQRLAAGSYLLTIEAKIGGTNARRDVRFSIK